VSIEFCSANLFIKSVEVYEPLAISSSYTLNPIPLSGSKEKLGPFNGGQNDVSTPLIVIVSTIGSACNLEIQTC